MVVAVIALYDFTFERGIAWRSRIPGYVAAAIPCLAYLLARAQVLNSFWNKFRERPRNKEELEQAAIEHRHDEQGPVRPEVSTSASDPVGIGR